jgi:DNA-binding transcriptional LysR family regulator
MNAPLNHPMPILDLDVLRTFVAIAETGSFTLASTAVFRTPSAVSMQIKKLEDILGVSVFTRDARSVSLTQDGEMLIGYARRMLALNREAVSKFIVPDIAGIVRLGSPDDYGERVLPTVLRRFAKTHPAIAVDVTIDMTSNLRRRLSERQLDITLFTARRDIPGDAEILLTEPIVWGRRQGWLRASARPAAGFALGGGMRVARRRTRRAGACGTQLPCRLYERAHRRPARGYSRGSRGRAAAQSRSSARRSWRWGRRRGFRCSRTTIWR